MSDFDEEMEKRYKKRRWKLTVFLLGTLAIIVPIIINTASSWIKENSTSKPTPFVPPTPTEPPVISKALLAEPFRRDVEVYFTVGQYHIEEGYVNKLVSLLNSIPEKKQCQVFIICSGDSRGNFDQTLDISNQRACEVKSHITEIVKGEQKEHWEKAKVWSFGRIVTPGLARPRLGEDFNCRCTVIATTDSKSIEQSYIEQLKAVRQKGSKYLSNKLKAYEVDDCNSSYKSHFH